MCAPACLLVMCVFMCMHVCALAHCDGPVKKMDAQHEHCIFVTILFTQASREVPPLPHTTHQVRGAESIPVQGDTSWGGTTPGEGHLLGRDTSWGGTPPGAPPQPGVITTRPGRRFINRLGCIYFVILLCNQLIMYFCIIIFPVLKI